MSAGLDYAAVGPEHAFYRDRGHRVHPRRGRRVLEAFQLCSRLEGIIPALESTHALVHAWTGRAALPPDGIILMNLSGRGDKDVQQAAELLRNETP